MVFVLNLLQKGDAHKDIINCGQGKQRNISKCMVVNACFFRINQIPNKQFICSAKNSFSVPICAMLSIQTVLGIFILPKISKKGNNLNVPEQKFCISLSMCALVHQISSDIQILCHPLLFVVESVKNMCCGRKG